MQKLDEQKRRAILDVAAKLFATRAFHEVRLEDVAQQAHIGKGTVYIYFKSKDDLFASLVREGFGRIVQRVQTLLDDESDGPAVVRIESVVRELVLFAKTYPYVFQLMRDGAGGQQHAVREIRKHREELGKLIGRLIRQGVESGELDDPRPELTGQYFPACVRAAIVFGPADMTVDDIVEHVMRVVGGSIIKQQPRQNLQRQSLPRQTLQKKRAS